MIGRLAFSFLLGYGTLMCGQATPTASRAGDLQVGVGYSFGHPDYPPDNFQGIAAYADFDLRTHLGVEAEFHQINHIGGYESFQRTYEIGGRYHREWGPLLPYAKAMIGRGQFEYPYGQALAGYNMFAGGLGIDVEFGPHLRVRGEYELQKWTNFPNGGLTPQIVTVGIAYHFAGERGYR